MRERERERERERGGLWRLEARNVYKICEWKLTASTVTSWGHTRLYLRTGYGVIGFFCGVVQV